MQRACRCGGFFHQRRILLRHLIHLADGLTCSMIPACAGMTLSSPRRGPMLIKRAVAGGRPAPHAA
jgi:hypothetical protein